MSDQRSDEKPIPGVVYVFFHFRLKLEPEILNCQILSSVPWRTANTLSDQIATSRIINIAFEELNDEGSDTVFHA